MPKQLAATKAAAKTASKKVKTPANSEAKWDESQREMVAREAYLAAEKRGFKGGDPVQDWLEAENKVRELF